MKKNYFFGKYYKFISETGFSFAIIIAASNEGESIQLITKNNSYQINDLEAVKIINDNHFVFSINQNDISLSGDIYLGSLNPLTKKVMGPFSYVPFMECRHNIYSMYHSVSGKILFNDEKIEFNDGIGYIEGDEGRNFPKKYVWYNSVTRDNSIIVAVASIPIAFIRFTGVLCFIKNKDKELYFCTWNRVKIKELNSGVIKLRKGKYELSIDISLSHGHKLKAPVNGDMSRYIKENLAVPSKYSLKYKKDTIIEIDDELSSCEWVIE